MFLFRVKQTQTPEQNIHDTKKLRLRGNKIELLR